MPGPVVARLVFGEPPIRDGGRDLANRSVGSPMVVDLDELIDQVLEAGDGLGGWPGGHPFLEGLLESFDLAAGGGMVGPGVLLADTEFDEFVLEGVA